MNEKLFEELKSARANLEIHKKTQNAALEEFKAIDDVYTYNKVMTDNFAQLVSELETVIRAEALAEFQATDNKHPHPKVEIKLFKTFSITEPAKVLAWVKTNLADALVVDEKKVKAYAMTEEPKALIASDL
jgi:hypothetical protein